MDYSEGDILRFEGTSGKMRTIMHVSPESSHAVTFDFFKCEDKNGYNYPIVRIGDMLWMLEDLKPVKMAGLESQGMLLCAEDDEDHVVLMTPEKKLKSGSKIC